MEDIKSKKSNSNIEKFVAALYAIIEKTFIETTSTSPRKTY